MQGKFYERSVGLKVGQIASRRCRSAQILRPDREISCIPTFATCRASGCWITRYAGGARPGHRRVGLKHRRLSFLEVTPLATQPEQQPNIERPKTA
jgi:hypothetical protein